MWGDYMEKELELSLEVEVLPDGVFAFLVIKNLSSKLQHINGRFGIDRGYDSVNELHFKIIDQNKNELTFGPRIDHGGCRILDIITLPANKSVSVEIRKFDRKINLEYYFGKFENGKEYEVQAFYGNSLDIEGVDLWKGKLESNKVKFRIPK
jgi:hypothetical protein